MKISKKILALLLALLVAAAMLVSCVTPDGSDDTTAPGDDSSTAPGNNDTTAPGDGVLLPPNDLALILNALSNSKVIRPESASTASTVVNCATDIRTAIGNATGTLPGIGTDWSKDGKYDADAIEILVGATNYPESAAVLSEITYGEYLVRIHGNKLIIAAYSDAALRIATNKFIELIKSLAQTGSLTIPSDTTMTDSVVKDLATLPSYEGGTFSATYECGGNATLLIVKNTNVAQYEEYLAKLKSNGFTEYTKNQITDNVFATLNSKDYTINVGYYDYEKSARIIIEPLAKPVGLESDNVYTAVTTSQITMFGLEYLKSDGTRPGNGLSILIRLTDGSFVIVDGGFNLATNAANLVDAMKEQSKGYIKTGEKITVSAWIITHSHGDHSGMIASHYSKFTSFNVEKFLVNFISDAERNKAINDTTTDVGAGEGGGWVHVITAAKALKADIQYVHVGQIFYIADLKLEVLYTIESFAPKICNAFNTTSLVMKMTFGGKTTYISTGDATGNGMQICSQMFGTYLKSDIVQVTHHGYTTWGNDSGVATAYRLIAPPIVLWPQGSTAYPSTKTRAFNAVLFSPALGGANPNYLECYVAGVQGDYVTVSLPLSETDPTSSVSVYRTK